MTEVRDMTRLPGPAPQDSALFSLDALLDEARAPEAPEGISHNLHNPLWTAAVRPVPRAKARAAAPRRGSSAPLLATIGALALSVGVLGFTVAATPHTIVVQAPSAVEAPTMTEMTAPEPRSFVPVTHDHAQGADHGHHDAEAEPEYVMELEPEPEPPAATRTRTSSKKRGSSSKSTSAKPSKGIAKPSAKPAPSKAADPFAGMGADCILDPSRCADGGGNEPASKAPTTKAPAAKPSRTSLGSTDVRTAIAPVKSAAKACGITHGAKSGEKVGVRLSIDGATGRVTKATPQAPHATGPLGRCVANALHDATFPTFAKPSMGLVYRVTM